jgi:L-fucose mutarotase
VEDASDKMAGVTGIMLIGIPPILGPDLLATLRAMGHGDEIAIVDGNYPAQDHARRLVRADGHGLLPLLDAILTVLPLDDDAPFAILRASQFNDPDQAGPFHQQIEALCGRLKPGYAVQALAGADLYPRIRAAHTIIASSEMALYANVILRKGVIREDG